MGRQQDGYGEPGHDEKGILHVARVLSPEPPRYVFRRGTLAPFFLASESPMAMACFRLFTLPPFPPGPLFRVPRFLRRMALSTVLLAAGP